MSPTWQTEKLGSETQHYLENAAGECIIACRKGHSGWYFVASVHESEPFSSLHACKKGAIKYLAEIREAATPV